MSRPLDDRDFASVKRALSFKKFHEDQSIHEELEGKKK